MSFLTRIFGALHAGERRERAVVRPLYTAIVAQGRDSFWYREGQVPDTIDGRFDMLSTVLALVLLRMEREGPAAAGADVHLTEVFIEDMDGTVRQIGIGDQVVGKHIGKMMSALGGRLGAYRDSGDDEAAFADAVRRNIFREAPPSDEAVTTVAARLMRLKVALDRANYSDLLIGKLPQP